MGWYCEWCGRRSSAADRLRGRGIKLAGDTGVYACARCREDMALVPRPHPRRTGSVRTATIVLAASVATIVASTALVTNVTSPRPDGGVLGVVGSPTSPPTPPSRSSTAGATAPPTRAPASPASSPWVPQLIEESPVVMAWTDSFDRPRVQIIVPVRNEGRDPIRIAEGLSGYRLMGAGRELARGGFLALPAVVEPGSTAYLVETRDDPAEGRLSLRVETTIVVERAEAPAASLVVTGLELDQAIGGGMRASGLVRNDGPRSTGSVTVGAVALAKDGRPVGAVLDRHDIVRLPPGDTRRFLTDVAAGAPVVPASAVETVVGVAFEP